MLASFTFRFSSAINWVFLRTTECVIHSIKPNIFGIGGFPYPDHHLSMESFAVLLFLILYMFSLYLSLCQTFVIGLFFALDGFDWQFSVCLANYIFISNVTISTFDVLTLLQPLFLSLTSLSLSLSLALSFSFCFCKTLTNLFLGIFYTWISLVRGLQVVFVFSFFFRPHHYPWAHPTIATYFICPSARLCVCMCFCWYVESTARNS